VGAVFLLVLGTAAQCERIRTFDGFHLGHSAPTLPITLSILDFSPHFIPYPLPDFVVSALFAMKLVTVHFYFTSSIYDRRDCCIRGRVEPTIPVLSRIDWRLTVIFTLRTMDRVESEPASVH